MYFKKMCEPCEMAGISFPFLFLKIKSAFYLRTLCYLPIREIKYVPALLFILSFFLSFLTVLDYFFGVAFVRVRLGGLCGCIE